jgi:hypothetical protein
MDVAQVFSALLFVGIPTPILFISWFRLVRVQRKPGFLVSTLALMALSLSYAIYLASVSVAPGILGPAYSDRRFITIIANIAVSVVSLVISEWKKIPSWEWITIPALMLGSLWFFVLIINGAV